MVVEVPVRVSVRKTVRMSIAHTIMKTVGKRSQDTADIVRAYLRARDILLANMKPVGYWEGHLSSSALSTATAISAFAITENAHSGEYIERGVKWLVHDQNVDGGWGDSPCSPSNIPTSMLVHAALNLATRRNARVPQRCVERVTGYLNKNAGVTGYQRLNTLNALYGKDRTFAVPILANCALAPSHGDVGVTWSDVPTLPFELAIFPRSLFRLLRLRVVSYALPALIAIGQLIHAKRGTHNPLLRRIRNAAIAPTLRLLASIQPASGGFLEAVPLTCFVVMSLSANGQIDHSVARKGMKFLKRLARADGSWPIDANLSTWLTSLSVDALSAGNECHVLHSARVSEWLLSQQHVAVHSYTNSPPGGWAWTDLPGGVPDADDTSAALIALSRLGAERCDGIDKGVAWLLGIQNRDGGWPTFCRGWGKLPFDRSAADLTAHALQALWTWRHIVPRKRLARAFSEGFNYLRLTQRDDGAWEPIWFGNQSVPGNHNPVYGTARVLGAYVDAGRAGSREVERATEYLISAQNPEGSWGGERGVQGTIEETALAVAALCKLPGNERIMEVCMRGARCLADMIEDGRLAHPAPIGLYFAKLWYAEMLYPVIWTVDALGRVLTAMKRSLPGMP